MRWTRLHYIEREKNLSRTEIMVYNRRQFHTILAAFLLAPLFFLCTGRAWARHSHHSHHSPDLVTGDHWIKTFDEEFDGDKLNTKIWMVSDGIPSVHEDPVNSYKPDEVSIGKGRLTIVNEKREAIAGFPFTAGEICSLNRFAQKYGRFEVRCRYPSLPGTWSAVYLLPASGVWPPEIDITEFIGRDPDKIYLTNHWGTQDNHLLHEFGREDPGIDWTTWHTYDLIWEPGHIQWIIDGQVRADQYDGVPDEPMYLRVNSCIGGIFAGSPTDSGWPQKFDVDYIRAYRRAGDPAPILGVTALPPNDTIVQQPIPTPPVGVDFSGQSPISFSWTFSDTVGALFFLFLWRWARRNGDAQPETVTKTLAVGVGFAAVFYLSWRASVINWNAPWIALALFAAEVFGVFQILGFQFTIWPRREPLIIADRDPFEYPIFILIPTVNEGVDILDATLRGAVSARDSYLDEHPGGAVTIAVCNDGYVGGYSDWKEIEHLAEKMGVLCVTRSQGGGAKAGNIENARQCIGATGQALVVVFDADMVAKPNFLLRTVPLFRDSTIGWTQTGQYYRNLDNRVAFWAHDQQMVFFEALCPGMARLNANFICGTNVVIRAAALDEIGGFPQDSVTEDYAASIALHSKWRSLYLTDILATGLGPVDLTSYFIQQRRWATGTLGVFFRNARRILLGERDVKNDAFDGGQRVQYLFSGTHYLSGLSQMVFFVAPLLVLYGGSAALTKIDLMDFIRHFAPIWLISQLACWRACGYQLRWRGAVLGFCSTPILVVSFFSVLFRHTTRFIVTPKSKKSSLSAKNLLFPHYAALALSAVGIIWAMITGTISSVAFICAGWTIYSMGMLGAVLYLSKPQMDAPEIPTPIATPEEYEWMSNFTQQRKQSRRKKETHEQIK